MRSNTSVINVYKKNSVKSGVVTQLLYGDTFQNIKKKSKWLKIKNIDDGYKGYIKNRDFPKNQKPTHKICNTYAKLYLKQGNNYKIKKKLSFGSKINVIKKQGNFYKFDKFWIKKNDLKSAKYQTKDIFKYIQNFNNTKYIWGYKSFNGIDCSGLVQIFFNFNNKFCPRDTRDQIKYFKKKVKIKNIRKNDLIFWKGHVAIAISKSNLIHAYGPSKKTLIMPIKKTINIIYKTANLKITGIRRID